MPSLRALEGSARRRSMRAGGVAGRASGRWGCRTGGRPAGSGARTLRWLGVVVGRRGGGHDSASLPPLRVHPWRWPGCPGHRTLPPPREVWSLSRGGRSASRSPRCCARSPGVLRCPRWRRRDGARSSGSIASSRRSRCGACAARSWSRSRLPVSHHVRRGVYGLTRNDPQPELRVEKGCARVAAGRHQPPSSGGPAVASVPCSRALRPVPFSPVGVAARTTRTVVYHTRGICATTCPLRVTPSP